MAPERRFEVLKEAVLESLRGDNITEGERKTLDRLLKQVTLREMEIKESDQKSTTELAADTTAKKQEEAIGGQDITNGNSSVNEASGIPTGDVKPTNLNAGDSGVPPRHDLLMATVQDLNSRLTHIEKQNQQLGKYLRHWDEAWVKQISDFDTLRVSFKAATSNISSLEDRINGLERQLGDEQLKVNHIRGQVLENSTAMVWVQGTVLMIMEQVITMGGRVQEVFLMIQNALVSLGIPSQDNNES